MADDVGDGLAEQVLEHLAGLARLMTRPMFGGVGLYHGRRMFGVVFRGALYLRADETMRRELARRGAGPFRPYRGRVVSAFWEVPSALTAEKRRLRALARRAMAATDEAARRMLAAPVRRRLERAKLAPPRARPPTGRRR
jgi:DNA transformation protein